MNKINILDCTLRDGGYVNNWDFGHSTIVCIFERLVSANIDIIEVGFLDYREEFDLNRTIQPTTACFDKLFNSCNKKKSLVFAMIDYGTCPLENISLCEESFLDGIRLIFKKPNAKKAIEYGKEIIKKGYKVCFQMVSVTSYRDKEILEFVEEVNKIEVFCVSIVDTYGLMHSKEVLHYFDLLNCNLKSSVFLGYHAHNNFQLAYSNSIELLNKDINRNIIIDGTVYGMGKSAGNTPLELLAMYLNRLNNFQYDIDQILEIIDVNIMKIHIKKYWGYNLLYFLSASNDCHPKYINYLLDKKTLSVKAINNVVKDLPIDYKLNFNKECIEELYCTYQKNTLYKNINIDKLCRELRRKVILILGPGKTIATYEKEILKFINENKSLVVFSANFVSSNIIPHYIFISNSKRYSMMLYDYKSIKTSCKTVATSNITSIDTPFDFMVNYKQFLDENEIIKDNSLIMLLNILQSIEVEKVFLAGFDGFSVNSIENYYSEYMELSADVERLLNVNVAIKERLVEIGDKIKINFITPSIYSKKDE